MSRLIGTITVHPDGYGFVIPERAESSDVFIPARYLWPAMHRDRVEVECQRPDARGRVEGRVLKVLERGLKQVVGRFERTGKSHYVVSDDSRVAQRITIPRGAEGGARHGDAVVVGILSYPDAQQIFTGRVTKVIGTRGSLDAETEAVIHHHQLATEFPEDVVREADRVYQRPMTSEEWEVRTDLRSLPLVTIDGETARDFDDAVCVEVKDGIARVWVAIADVSYYVEPGSLLDREALARGTSVYFPGRCLPMLPPQLSDDLCSLRPNEERRAMVAEFSVTEEGLVERPRFYRALMRSRARLTYTQVWEVIRDARSAERSAHSAPRSAPCEVDPTLLPMLKQMADVCRLLQKQRRARGSIDFDLPEPQIVLDMQGGPEAIIRAERNFAHQMIEELMIAANEAVARALTGKGRRCVYRVHEGPDPDRMREFAELLKHLGVSVRLPLPPKPADLARVVTIVRGRSEERWINHSLLRSMAQAVYDTNNIGHFGLASKCYCHFTSPIRRYPDLVVHRLLTAIIDQQQTNHKPRTTKHESLQSIAQHCSRRERVALEAEREMAKVYAAFFLKERIGMIFDGVISHMTKFGFYVELADYFVEGMVAIRDLPDDRYVYDPKHLSFVGRRSQRKFSIGDRCRVRLEEVKVESREIRFVLDLS